MSALLFAAAVLILVWVIPYLVSRWLGSGSAERVEFGLLLLPCLALAGFVYVV